MVSRSVFWQSPFAAADTAPQRSDAIQGSSVPHGNETPGTSGTASTWRAPPTVTQGIPSRSIGARTTSADPPNLPIDALSEALAPTLAQATSDRLPGLFHSPTMTRSADQRKPATRPHQRSPSTLAPASTDLARPGPASPAAMDESPPDASVDARRHDLPDPLPAAVASIADALLGLLGWPEDVAIQVSVPCQAPLHYARVRTPRHLIEIIFNPTTGRFDCTSCQAVPLELPPGSASDGGFLRAVLQGLAGATATALLQASPFLIEPWENWALAQEAVEAAPDPEERMGIPGATRVRRKERA